jgi:hypothetical protein
MPAHKVPTRLPTIAEEMRRQVVRFARCALARSLRLCRRSSRTGGPSNTQPVMLQAGAPFMFPVLGTHRLRPQALLRAGDTKATKGSGAHELPATTSHFHRSQYSADGFNSRCKDCCRDYQRYANGTWNAHIAERKAKAAP